LIFNIKKTIFYLLKRNPNKIINNIEIPCNITLALINLFPHFLLNSPPRNIEIIPIDSTTRTANKKINITYGIIDLNISNIISSPNIKEIRYYFINSNNDNIFSFPNKSITSSLL